MTVTVRFAPSPTGFLHIGGARTALFNWLFARHHGGKFLMRVEDTDRARSTPESVDTILDGMRWLGLDWDNHNEPENGGKNYYSQFAMRDRHVEVAKAMIEKGAAYYCYASPEELTAMREEQKEKGLPQRYDGRWRDRDPSEAPEGVAPVVRLKAPLEGETIIEDQVMGKITVKNEQLDDMVLLRGDGTPTYMLAVVVDDHDMGITHVIRGDDHMTNAFRQVQIYKAMGWDVPTFAHLPLIHGPDGAKFSKRHGAPAVGTYRDEGYLPEAMTNYLLRLCWSHGDDEIISTKQAIEWFDLDSVGKSPARFDFAKLKHLNAHYINEMDDEELAKMVAPYFSAHLGRDLNDKEMNTLVAALPDIKPRVQLLNEIADIGMFFFTRINPDEKAQQALTPEAKEHLAALKVQFEILTEWSTDSIKTTMKSYAQANELKLGVIAKPLRAALTGGNSALPIFSVAALLGQDEVIARLG